MLVHMLDCKAGLTHHGKDCYTEPRESAIWCFESLMPHEYLLWPNGPTHSHTREKQVELSSSKPVTSDSQSTPRKGSSSAGTKKLSLCTPPSKGLLMRYIGQILLIGSQTTGIMSPPKHVPLIYHAEQWREQLQNALFSLIWFMWANGTTVWLADNTFSTNVWIFMLILKMQLSYFYSL